MAMNLYWVEVQSLWETYMGKPEPVQNIFSNPRTSEWIDQMKAYLPPEYTHESIFSALWGTLSSVAWKIIDSVETLLIRARSI